MAEETRDRIVAGAYRALVHDGYEATSIKDIAEEAGVAPGLIHYYFNSKEGLLVAAVRHACRELAQRTEPTQDIHALLSAHRDFTRLLLCMIGVSLHNSSIAQPVRDFISEQRAFLEGFVRDAIAKREGNESDAPAIAAAFWGGVIGIMIQDFLDPEFEAHPAIDALTRMVLGQECC